MKSESCFSFAMASKPLCLLCGRSNTTMTKAKFSQHILTSECQNKKIIKTQSKDVLHRDDKDSSSFICLGETVSKCISCLHFAFYTPSLVFVNHHLMHCNPRTLEHKHNANSKIQIQIQIQQQRWIQIQVQVQIQIWIQKYKTSQPCVSFPPHFAFKTIMNLGIRLHFKAAILFNKEPSRSPLHLAQGREDNLSKRLPIWDDNLGIGCPPEYGEITWA